MRLVLAQSTISSQLIDNLNASIHLRALLTDLFLVDEILKPLQRAQTKTCIHLTARQLPLSGVTAGFTRIRESDTLASYC